MDLLSCFTLRIKRNKHVIFIIVWLPVKGFWKHSYLKPKNNYSKGPLFVDFLFFTFDVLALTFNLGD